MRLTPEQVDYIAELAKLDLDEAERARYGEQLSAVLDYAAQLQAVPTDNIPPTASVLPIVSPLRADEIQPSLPLADALRNAPDTFEGQFRVDAVLDSD